jgi:hypothetical protein
MFVRSFLDPAKTGSQILRRGRCRDGRSFESAARDVPLSSIEAKPPEEAPPTRFPPPPDGTPVQHRTTAGTATKYT